jgi:16S rRNA (uracil1498-N3)-methyltransferase
MMQRRRFYAAHDSINGPTVNLSRDETHHLARVLRLRPGDEVFAFDGRGREYRCAFQAVIDNRARLEVIETLANRVESPVHLTLAQALAKGEKFDLVIQKATELGAGCIIPLVTGHTDVKLSDEKSEKRIERWRRISLEALKQCGRRRLVEIKTPLALGDFLESNTPAGTLFVFSERGGVTITAALLSEAIDKKNVTAVIGPEGGWSDDELALLNGRGAISITLGPRILRTETAAIVALALIQHALGDLSAPDPQD